MADMQMVAAAMSEPALVDIRALTKRYPEGERERVVFSGLDLCVARGERLAVVGRSGSGKSTLLNLIAGIDRADGGSIEVDGQDITRLSETARTLFRRRRIGVIYQFFNLIPTLTVTENVRLPLELNGMAAAPARERANEMLSCVGLAGRGEAFPERLSGGEQQRVAVARALVHEPLLLLADEPTGNLDAATGAHISELIVERAAAAGATLVLVTHDPALAAMAGRVWHLDTGEPEGVRA